MKSGKKIIITGGPASGKTTTISLLKEIGYQTIPESARIIIEKTKLISCHSRQKLILKQQIINEKNILTSKDIFIDQGFIDIEIYNLKNKYKENKMYGLIKNSNYYKKVFLLENLNKEVYPNNREETFSESVRLSKEIENAYKKYGFKVIKIKPDTPQKRVKLILNQIYDK